MVAAPRWPICSACTNGSPTRTPASPICANAGAIGAKFDVLIYYLTKHLLRVRAGAACTPLRFARSATGQGPGLLGYSRDQRSDCVQVVVALIVTPEGLPLAYEMFPDKTVDKTTLRDMLALIQKRHG